MMNEPNKPKGPRGNAHDLAEQAIDETDVETLAVLASLYDTVDPVPAELVDRLRFGLALDEMMAEVASLTRMPVDAMSVRGETAEATRAETITFSADALTAMVTIARTSRHTVRLDGWLAPASAMVVRLRMKHDERRTSADGTGRFSFEEVPRGFAQLIFQPDEDSDTEAVVVTPVFEL